MKKIQPQRALSVTLIPSQLVSKGMKIGIAKEYLEGVRDDVKEAVLKAADIYKSMGAEIVCFDLPELKFAFHCLLYHRLCRDIFKPWQI